MKLNQKIIISSYEALPVHKKNIQFVEKALEMYGLEYEEWQVRHFAYIVENASEEDYKSLPVIVQKAIDDYIEEKKEHRRIQHEMDLEKFKFVHAEQLEDVKLNKAISLEGVKTREQKSVNDRSAIQNHLYRILAAPIILFCWVGIRLLLNDPIIQKIIKWILGIK